MSFHYPINGGGGGGGSPAGSDTQIQYNNAGAFGASSDLTFDPATSTFKAVTDNPLFRSTIKFSSNGGTDDLTASLATAFTGTPPTTFAVLAYGNIQIVNYINLVGGNFSQGDTITGSVSGAEGYVAYDDGVGQFYVSITNSIQFAATDVIDNANGVTADYDTSTTSDDIFFWFSTNGGSGGPIVMTGSAQLLDDGISITFGSTTGHGAEDSWLWSYKTLKNTWLTNSQAEGAVSGYVNGSVYDNGSNNIVAINGLVQNGDDDRIFPLSFYQDLSSGNRNERERAYYGLDIFKGDPAKPLEFVVKTQKGIGAGPGPIEISSLRVGTLSGFEFTSDKSFQVSTPLFVTQGSLFSWTGDTNGNGITIDDTNNEITLATSHTQQSAVSFTGSGLDDLTVSGTFSGTVPTTYTVTIDGVNIDFLVMDTSSISGGSFAISDTVTNGTGGIATVLSISVDGTNTYLGVNITAGSFSAFDVIDNGSGVTATIGTPEVNDTYTLTDGTTTLNDVPALTNPNSTLNGIKTAFGASIGHTLTDEWTWDYTSVNQNVLDFSNNDYKFQSVLGTDTFGYQIGDNLLGFGLKGSVNTWVNGSDFSLSGTYLQGTTLTIGTTIQMGSATSASLLEIDKSYTSISDGTDSGNYNLRVNQLALSNTIGGIDYGIEQSAGAVTVGNLLGGNNTKITVDDVAQLITVSNVPTYADDAAAATGGLTTGQLYKTTTLGTTSLNIVP